MPNKTEAELKLEAETAAAEKAKAEADAKAKAEQDLLKTELEKARQQSKYTEKEKAEHALKANAKRAKELGLDPASVLGIDGKVEEIDEDTPPAWFVKHESKKATDTALQLADEVQNETERELIKHHLSSTFKSGDAKKDFSDARLFVNALKNKQIIEEQQRKIQAKNNSSGGGIPPKEENLDENEELTLEELKLMKLAPKMTKAQILSARKGVQLNKKGEVVPQKK